MEDILKHYQHLNTAVFCNLDVPKSLLQEWRSIIDLLANFGGASTGLIMKIEDEELGVLVASQTEGNPYSVGDKALYENSGLYCETVIKTSEKLYIENALKVKGWEQNPNLEQNLVNYLGFPIKLPNGQPFGTICLMNEQEKQYSAQFIEIMEKMRDLIESQLKILSISFQDPLTNTYNRTFFNAKVVEKIARAERNGTPLTMLVLDIDKFKSINDEFGHLVGDQVLCSFAEVINANVQPADVVVRYGGEEFVVLMPKTDLLEGIQTAESIRAEIEKSPLLADRVITASIGVAQWRAEESIADWYRRADKALYAAKESGRNQVMVCAK